MYTGGNDSADHPARVFVVVTSAKPLPPTPWTMTMSIMIPGGLLSAEVWQSHGITKPLIKKVTKQPLSFT